ncbi:unnamed protein product [Polarella glacialis]|uniref:Endo-beta-1,6-galactanase-like domain-containing protein n=1 Tax=Polarella glacialis TaxID=89957 RepID=A0A813G4M2_POLGL|nr:unnamed protein product [Polarella glacialis]
MTSSNMARRALVMVALHVVVCGATTSQVEEDSLDESGARKVEDLMQKFNARNATHPCKFCPPESDFGEELAIMEEQLKHETKKLKVKAIRKYGPKVAAQKLNPHATIDLTNGQTFEHWGSSLCWWAVGVGEWSNTSQLDSLLDLIYSNFSAHDLTQGLSDGTGIPATLGLTQARYNIGGSPWQPLYSPKTSYRPGAAVQSYLNENGTWNWSADAGQRKVLAGALQRGLASAQAFSNSPPWWMTKSQSSTGALPISLGNHVLPIAWNNLADENVTQFGAYLAAVCNRFATDASMLFGRTLEFNSLSPLNEPGSVWWIYNNTQEGCHVSYDQQPKVLEAVLDHLQQFPATAKTAVAAAEGNKVIQTARSLHSYSASLRDKLGLVTTHQYSLSTSWAFVDIKQENDLLAKSAAKNDKDLWVSEFGTGSGPLQGGLRLAKRIINGLLYLNATTWTLWQVVSLHQDLGPNGWAQIVATYPPVPAKFQIRKQYYAYKQFTAFIRPGSRILGGCRLCALSRVDMLIVLLADGKTAIIVAVNLGATSKKLKLNLNGATVLSTVATFLTDATANCSSIASPGITRGSLNLNLSPESITTFVVKLDFAAPLQITQQFAMRESPEQPVAHTTQMGVACAAVLAVAASLILFVFRTKTALLGATAPTSQDIEQLLTAETFED